jgi:hypothetical protein
LPGPELGKSGLFELNAGNPCMTSDALVDNIEIHGISQKSNKISLFNNGRGCNCASQATVWAEYPQKIDRRRGPTPKRTVWRYSNANRTQLE